MEHRTEIVSGPKGFRWECRCGTAGAWTSTWDSYLVDKGKAHMEKFNQEGDR